MGGAGEGTVLVIRANAFVGFPDPKIDAGPAVRCPARPGSHARPARTSYPVAVPERSCDVLVIGSGVAGLTAALSAARTGGRVLLATKLGLASSNTAKAQGGIQAALGADDSPSIHAEDVMHSSHETADPRLVAALTGEAPAAIERLERFGVAFTHDDGGGYRLARCGGATRKRLLQVGDRTGHAIATALREAVASDARIGTLDHAPLEALDAVPAGWQATLGQREDGSQAIAAGAVVLAAGGRCYAEARRLGTFSTNAAGATGEVTDIALAAGCEAR